MPTYFPRRSPMLGIGAMLTPDEAENKDVSRGYTSKPMFDECDFSPNGDASDTARNQRRRLFEQELDDEAR